MFRGVSVTAVLVISGGLQMTAVGANAIGVELQPFWAAKAVFVLQVFRQRAAAFCTRARLTSAQRKME